MDTLVMVVVSGIPRKSISDLIAGELIGVGFVLRRKSGDRIETFATPETEISADETVGCSLARMHKSLSIEWRRYRRYA
jgi:hypothetical protein